MFKIIGFVIMKGKHNWEPVPADLVCKINDLKQIHDDLLTVPEIERVLITLKEIK